MPDVTDRLILVLARHGQVEAPYQNRYLGRLDAPLSAEGLRQAAAMGRRLSGRDFDKVLCSPMLRARQTAGELPFEAEIRPELCEVDFGQWEGRTFEEISRDWPDAARDWTKAGADFVFPGGEKVSAFLERVGRISREIAAGRNGACLVVAHGGVIRAFICELLGLGLAHFSAFRVQYASLTTIEIREGFALLSCLNDTSHIEAAK